MLRDFALLCGCKPTSVCHEGGMGGQAKDFSLDRHVLVWRACQLMLCVGFARGPLRDILLSKAELKQQLERTQGACGSHRPCEITNTDAHTTSAPLLRKRVARASYTEVLTQRIQDMSGQGWSRHVEGSPTPSQLPAAHPLFSERLGGGFTSTVLEAQTATKLFDRGKGVPRLALRGTSVVS